MRPACLRSGRKCGILYGMITYELIRSARRTVSLEVTKECCVRVRAPLRMPKREIDIFVESHREWVERQLEKRRAMPQKPEPTAREIAELKEKTRQLVEPLVARYSAEMGFRPTGIRVPTARTRYGS